MRSVERESCFAMLPLLLLLLTAGPEALAHDDDAPERLVPDYDYQAGVRYDEYPVHF